MLYANVQVVVMGGRAGGWPMWLVADVCMKVGDDKGVWPSFGKRGQGLAIVGVLVVGGCGRWLCLSGVFL